jgi:hypothetical protein
MPKKQVRRVRRRAETARQARVARALNDLMPPAARAHLRQARREMLLAVRDILDHAITRAETTVRARGLRRIRVK